MPAIDMTGKRYGKLVVLRATNEREKNGAIIWECQCDCGNIVQKSGNYLRKHPNTNHSCGCASSTPILDLTNQRFGSLVAIRPTENRTNGKVVWECQCDCGNTHYAHASNLKNGAVQSCGCSINKYKNLNLSAQQINNFKVIKKINNSSHLCKCSCGNIISVKTYDLVNGTQKTCGECHKYNLFGQVINNWLIIKDTDKRNNGYIVYECECLKCGQISYKTIQDINHAKGSYCSYCHKENLIGQKFGYLTVISEDTKRNQKTYWNCQCVCGKNTSVSASNLKSGNTKSCGCLKRSGGEQQIINFLQLKQIVFEEQKTFETCRFKDTNELAKFDFYLPDFNTIIEYDGQQHFKETSIFKDTLQDIQKRDNYKTQWCEENRIFLIRIPYFNYNKIEEIIDKCIEVKE